MPVLVGGSNSLIHGFLAEQYDPYIGDPFANARYRPNLRFKSYLLWLHVDELALNEYLNRRIDDMVDDGLVEEIKEYYDTMSIGKIDSHNGLARAIGVRELKEYFTGHRGLSTCIDEMKVNTQALARSQTKKICHICWRLGLACSCPRCHRSHVCTSQWIKPNCRGHNMGTLRRSPCSCHH